jgi:hypothetical protein
MALFGRPAAVLRRPADRARFLSSPSGGGADEGGGGGQMLNLTRNLLTPPVSSFVAATLP